MSPQDDRSPVRLSPPPKIGQPPGADGDDAAARRARADRGLRYWLTAMGFLALVAAAVAVFAILPRWVTPPTPTDPAQGTEAAAAPPPGTEEPAATPPTEKPPAEVATTAAAPQSGIAMETPTREPAPPPRQSSVERPVASRKPAPDPAEAAFTQAMSAGLAHLAQGDLDDAEAAFQQALSTRPEADEARDGLARVATERQLIAIADHRERATAYEKDERWKEAAEQYAAVLALDATIAFAQDGHRRSVERQELSERLDFHISQSERLSSDQVLAEARRLLETAGETAPSGPRLERQTAQLRALVEVASTPLPVVLVSDGLTEVTVFRVGRLGAFERHRLELRPGTYTIVGTRDGYRDVRRTLEVAPGNTASVDIRCQEAI